MNTKSLATNGINELETHANEDTRIFCNCREIDCKDKPDPNTDAPPYDYFPTPEEKQEMRMNSL